MVAILTRGARLGEGRRDRTRERWLEDSRPRDVSRRETEIILLVLPGLRCTAIDGVPGPSAVGTGVFSCQR